VIKLVKKVMCTHCTANSLVGVRINTRIAGIRRGRNSNLSKIGKPNAAVYNISYLSQLYISDKAMVTI
jgi:hypothetical protein